MPRIPEPDEDRLDRIERIVDDLQKGSPSEWQSNSNGLAQFIGGKLQGLAGAVFEWVGEIITKGPWTNEGKLTNIGELEQNGPSEFNGPVSITGADGTLDVEAIANFGGDVKVTKTLDVTAEATFHALTKVLGDLRVEEDGKVYIGTAMVLDPTVQSGAITFQNGAQVFTNGDSIQVFKGNAVVQLQGDSARLQFGGSAIVIDDTGIHFYGAVFAHNLPTVADDANATADPSTGRLGKTAD
jgi:hypothetical protein